MRRAGFIFIVLITLAAHHVANGVPATTATYRACQSGSGIYPTDCPRFGQPGQFLANNRHHHVDFFDTRSMTGATAQWVLDNRFPGLGFAWTWVDGASYDVRISDTEYPHQDWYGKVTCPDRATTGGSSPVRWCHGQVLKINLTRMDMVDTTFGRRVVLCHELGHTVGLNHPDERYEASTCLENERTPDRSESSGYDDVDKLNTARGY